MTILCAILELSAEVLCHVRVLRLAMMRVCARGDLPFGPYVRRLCAMLGLLSAIGALCAWSMFEVGFMCRDCVTGI